MNTTSTGINHTYTTSKKGRFAMKSRLTVVLTAVTLAGAALVPVAAKAGGAPPAGRGGGTTGPACAVTFVAGKQTCFTPAQATQAERSAPWAIRPDAAVDLTFGLKLSQVSTLQAPGARSVTEIDYLYGPLRHDYGRQGPRPVAIRVAEYRNRADESRFKPAWTHQVCGVKVEISPAANPSQAHPSYGPWYLIGNMKHGNRSIGIVANTGQVMLQTLACRILQNS